MPYDPNKHHRRSIRLKGYDYTQAGAYFVTIVTQDRECLFGEVVEGEMRVNPFGEIVAWAWNDLPNHNPHVELDAFVVMPNHVHGIVLIVDDLVGAGSEPAPTMAMVTTRRHGLPEIVRQFKTFSARRINALRGTPGATVWQRNYYEHIIRNEASLNRIREYILTNPLRWHLDVENPNATGVDILWDSLFSPTQNTNTPTP
jgi:REP element-mobilizing transposase RayT